MKAIAIALACLVAGLAIGRWWGVRSVPAPPALAERLALSDVCRTIGEQLLFVAETRTDMPPMYLRGVAAVGSAATVHCMDRVERAVKRNPTTLSFSKELEAVASAGVVIDDAAARAALARAGRMLVEGSRVLMANEMKVER